MSKNDGPYRDAPPRAPMPRNWRWALYFALAVASGVPAGILARGVGAAVYGFANRVEPPQPCSEKFERTPDRGYSVTCDNGGRVEIQNGGEFYQCKCPGGTP